MVDVFELLNEAAGFLPETAAIIRQFWLDGYTAVREEAGEGVKIMIGDAFMTVNVGGDQLNSSSDSLNAELDQLFDLSQRPRRLDGLCELTPDKRVLA